MLIGFVGSVHDVLNFIGGLWAQDNFLDFDFFDDAVDVADIVDIIDGVDVANVVMNLEAADVHNSNSRYLDLLRHPCEIQITPAQYDIMRTLVSALNHLMEIRPYTPLNNRSQEFLFTMRQVVCIYELTGGAPFHYNVFNTSILPGASLLASQPDIFDVARFSSPEFTTLLDSLRDIFLYYKNSKNFQLQAGFYAMNNAIERFVTNSHTNLFSDHPLLNMEIQHPNRFVMLFGHAIRAFNFLF